MPKVFLVKKFTPFISSLQRGDFLDGFGSFQARKMSHSSWGQAPQVFWLFFYNGVTVFLAVAWIIFVLTSQLPSIIIVRSGTTGIIEESLNLCLTRSVEKTWSGVTPGTLTAVTGRAIFVSMVRSMSCRVTRGRKGRS